MTEHEVFEHFKIFGRNLSGDDNCIRDLAKKLTLWHLKELKKAELMARIVTHKEYIPDLHAANRIAELQSELRKLEEG